MKTNFRVKLNASQGSPVKSSRFGMPSNDKPRFGQPFRKTKHLLPLERTTSSETIIKDDQYIGTGYFKFVKMDFLKNIELLAF